MSAWPGYLSNEQLQNVQKAIVELNLCRQSVLDALLLSLNRAYAASLASGPTPISTLQVQLKQMNDVPNLRNGEVPLAKYLQAAIEISGDQPAVQVLEDALQTINAYAGARPPKIVTAHDSINTLVKPEAQVTGADKTLEVQYLQLALASTASVFRVRVHRHMDGSPQYTAGDIKRTALGTAWVIGPGLIITNYHVINARMQGMLAEPEATADDFRLQAENTQVDFDYFKVDAPSATISTTTGALMAADAQLDFAILRLPEQAPKRPPLRLRTRLIVKKPQLELDARVNVLQHPNGNPMRLGFRENYVVFGDANVLSYLTDTDLGSSGSPVCDDAWMVAALHRGARSIRDQEIMILGKKVTMENYGTPIPTIMETLAAKYPALHQEILKSQVALTQAKGA